MPVQNKACMERYIQKCQERHKQKVSTIFFNESWWKASSYLTLILISPIHIQLRDMKCSIDNKCPRAATHLKTKAKKNALMEDHFAQIETENRLLLEKMSHIMRVSQANSPHLQIILEYPASLHWLHLMLFLDQRRHRLPQWISEILSFSVQGAPETWISSHHQGKPTNPPQNTKCSASLFTHEMGGGSAEER